MRQRQNRTSMKKVGSITWPEAFVVVGALAAMAMIISALIAGIGAALPALVPVAMLALIAWACTRK